MKAVLGSNLQQHCLFHACALLLQWLSEQQFLILHGRGRDDPVVPSAYLKLLLLADAVLKPHAPRLPLPHSPESLEASAKAERKRARSPSPGPAQPRNQPSLVPMWSSMQLPSTDATDEYQQQQPGIADMLAPATPTVNALAGSHGSFSPAAVQHVAVEEVCADPQPEASLGCLLDELLQQDDLQLFPEDSWPGLVDPFSLAGLSQEDGSLLTEPLMSQPQTPTGTPRQPARYPVSPDAQEHPERSPQPACAQPSQRPIPASARQQPTEGAGFQTDEPCRWDQINVDPANMHSMGIPDLLQVGTLQQGHAAQPAEQPVAGNAMHHREQEEHEVPPLSWEKLFESTHE